MKPNIYRNHLNPPSADAAPKESFISKEELEWQVWRTHPQTIEFIKRLRIEQRKADNASKAYAINGDEKLLRAANIESLIIDKTINLTTYGVYNASSQS